MERSVSYESIALRLSATRRRSVEERHRQRIRFLTGLCVSLGLVLVAVQLPLYPRQERIGWTIFRQPGVQASVDGQAFGLLAQQFQQFGGLNPERAGSDVSAATVTPASLTPVQQDAIAATETQQESPRRAVDLSGSVRKQQVLQFADVMPDIVGGVGSYYISIVYPEAAAKDGIEGRLLLNFVVETNGTASDIRVLKSLHPLCDSAAVQALRTARFVPATNKGKRVRVRMTLPVRFVLVNKSSVSGSYPASIVN